MPAPDRAPNRKIRPAESRHLGPPAPAYRERSLHPAARLAAVELHASPALRNRRFPSTGSQNKPLAGLSLQTIVSPYSRGQPPQSPPAQLALAPPPPHP